MSTISKPPDRRIGAGLVVVLLAGVGIWWLANPSDETKNSHLADHPAGSPDQSVPSDPKAIPVIQHVKGPQRARFAVFRTPPEGLPAPMIEAMREPIYGMNWALAQNLSVATAEDVWAVPGNGFICLLGAPGKQSVSVTCNTTKVALSSGLATIFLRDAGTGASRSSRVIVGIAPDRADAVIARAPGSTVRIPVVGGVFMRRDRVTNPPDHLRLVKHAASEEARAQR